MSQLSKESGKAVTSVQRRASRSVSNIQSHTLKRCYWITGAGNPDSAICPITVFPPNILYFGKESLVSLHPLYFLNCVLMPQPFYENEIFHIPMVPTFLYCNYLKSKTKSTFLLLTWEYQVGERLVVYMLPGSTHVHVLCMTVASLRLVL